MSMYDMVNTVPEGYSEGEALSEMFDSKDLAAMDEVFAERDIDIITEEINFYKQQAGMAILEIGKRLAEAKEQLPHGEWLPWLEKKVEFSERSAQQYIRLWREYGKSATVADLGLRKALVLLALPENEREEFAAEKHPVDSGEKDAREMTVKELEKAIAERNEAREEAERAAAEIEEAKNIALAAQENLARVQAELEALEKRPVEVAVQQVDASAEQLEAARQEAREQAERKLHAELDRAKSDLEKAMEGKQEAEAKAAEAAREREAAREAAKSYKAEAEAAQRRAQAAAREELTRFKVLFDQTVANVNDLAGLLGEMQDAEREKMQRALRELSRQLAGIAG